MQTTGDFLNHLSRRIGDVGIWLILLALVALVLTLGLATTLVVELSAATGDPVQVAPFRWFSRA